MRNTIRRLLKTESHKQLTEGAATLVYDYYANPNAISNNLGWCMYCHSHSVHENICVHCHREFERVNS